MIEVKIPTGISKGALKVRARTSAQTISSPPARAEIGINFRLSLPTIYRIA